MNLYSERQILARSKWMLLLVLSLSIPLIISLVQFTKDPSQFKDDLIISIAVLGVLVIFLSLFRLELYVSDQGVSYRWFPFHWKLRHISFDTVDKAYVRKYNALKEYGGWGLKGFSRKNMAYNMVGSMGLQLLLKDGKKILIGTQQASSLQSTMDYLYHHGVVKGSDELSSKRNP